MNEILPLTAQFPGMVGNLIFLPKMPGGIKNSNVTRVSRSSVKTLVLR